MVAIGGEHFVESIGGGQHHFGNQRGVFLGQLRREDVLELMRQFAKFAKAASRGITLKVWTARRTLRRFSLSAGWSSRARPASFMFWRISAALSKKSSRSSDARSSGRKLTAPPRFSDTRSRYFDESCGTWW